MRDGPAFFLRLMRRQGALITLLPLLAFMNDTQAQYRSLPCPEERQASLAILRRIENEWPMRSSGDPVTSYIQNLGKRLARLTEDGRRIEWRFAVVRNLAPNAYSIGNGYVFITEGAVNLAQNESELAGILAHELGHELAGHFCRVPEPSGGFFDLFSAEKSSSHRIGVGSMFQEIDPVKEQQADRIALNLLKIGGFNPHAMLEAFRRMPAGSIGHVSGATRIQSLERALSVLPDRPIPSSKAFLRTKRLLSAEQGVIR